MRSFSAWRGQQRQERVSQHAACNLLRLCRRGAMAVTKATDDYLQDEDTVAQWLAECCTVGDPSRYKETYAALFVSWRKWCERLGEQPGSQKALFPVAGARRVRALLPWPRS